MLVSKHDIEDFKFTINDYETNWYCDFFQIYLKIFYI